MDNSTTNHAPNLNPAQLEAVTAPISNSTILVLAGAGSGKTRVLTQRISWLINQGTPIHNILAVTFTNKAASEMRHRLESMLGINLRQMWLGTFHGLAHRFLRIHWQEAGLDQNFQIIDADDQQRLVKRIHKELNLDEEKWPHKQSVAFINKNKEMCRRPHHIKPLYPPEQTLQKIYQNYAETCERGNLVDFAELLLRTYELLQNKPELLTSYKQRFQHILVDEFQDTNSLQYLWIKMLALGSANLMVVGDDDQSIYGWRGANVENIQHVLHDFTQPKIIRLEQNYRSTSVILKAANAVIARNNNRLGKNLWTDGQEGECISVYEAINGLDEAKYVIKKIHAMMHYGARNHDERDGKPENNKNRLDEIAILYRSNAQSRLFEEQLIQAQIPYRIYGGLRFFERAEIKDTTAYLRLLINPHDDASLERIINTPTRGIGETTLLTLRNYAQNQTQQPSLYTAIPQVLEQQLLSTRAAAALQAFWDMLQQLQQQLMQLELPKLVDYVIKNSGLHAHFAKDKNERNLMRIDNLEELVAATQQFALDNHDLQDNRTLLSTFLANAALEAGNSADAAAITTTMINNEDGTTAEHANNCIQLMTLHSAKGLEFNTVFLCGLEDGLFPHSMSMMTREELEEERRLCYVGITRARHKLFCTYAESRQLHGVTSHRRPSRFLDEIPEELRDSESALINARPTATMMQQQNSWGRGSYGNGDSSYSSNTKGNRDSRNSSYSSYRNNNNFNDNYSQEEQYQYPTHPATSPSQRQQHPQSSYGVVGSNGNSGSCSVVCNGLRVGQKVKHAKFGEGIIIGFEGNGDAALIQIKFTKIGTKWLSPAYAKLEAF
jgi:DNA helicase II / ATP-dependent DNA helicase PcrA